MRASAESRRLRVAVIGLGRWGSNYLATLSRLSECHLVAGVDPDQTKHAGRPFPVYEQLGDLLCHVDCDAVIVASPDHTHYTLTYQALQANKHVLVEKPMALNAEHAKELARFAKTRNRVLAVGHTMVYHDGFRSLRKAVAGGSLGDPVRLTAVRTSRGSASSAGVLGDLVSHDIAMTTALFGLPLVARSRFRADGRALSYQLLYPKDMVVSGWAAWTSGPRVRRFRVCGTLGTMVFSDCFPADGQDWKSLPLTSQCADFIRACLSGTLPCAGADQGVLVALCLAALARSGDGTWVSVEGKHWIADQSRQLPSGVLV
ncbi:MAG: Gfo/Idh/MocA family oxidoreductase [candidate division WOR-3 bacterium]